MGKSLKRKDLGKGIDQLKDGRYRGRYTNEYGKRVAIYNYNLTKLKRELKEKQKKTLVVKEINDGEKLTADITFNELYERWRDNELLPGCLKINTKLGYISCYKNHLKNAIGELKIKKINYDILLNIYNNLKINYSKSTINNCFKVLRIIYKYAFKNRIINSIPYMKFPPIDEKKKVIYLTDDEQDILLQYSAKHNKYFSCIITIALHTGMRVGEITGLRKQDIDLDNNIIKISQQLQSIRITQMDILNEKDIICISGNVALYIVKPKSETSIRYIPIDEECKKSLLWLKENRNNHTRNMNTRYIIKNQKMIDELFILYNNRPLKGTTLNKHLRSIIKEIQKDNQSFSINELSMHGLRHTFATRCLDKSINTRVIQTILGHKSDKITEIYAHVTDKKIFEEFKKFND